MIFVCESVTPASIADQQKGPTFWGQEEHGHCCQDGRSRAACQLCRQVTLQFSGSGASVMTLYSAWLDMLTEGRGRQSPGCRAG